MIRLWTLRPDRARLASFIAGVTFVVGVAAKESNSSGQSLQQLSQAREKMVQEEVVGAGVSDPRVIAVMLETPRHEFVPRSQRPFAYYDMALPIGEQQTISSPFIVAFMTESLQPQPDDKVLEIGTGSGYQAAVLSKLVKDVYTIEIVESLGQKARRTLRRLDYRNVHVKIGDGFAGWPEYAPFDKIIVTCSPEKVPAPLVEQLREGGRMVIPVGERYQQTLVLLRKKDGKLQSESLRPTLFVPMTGKAESARSIKPELSGNVVNGGFEEDVQENGHVPGWYYQRQLRWAADESAPEGEHFVVFHNDTPGRTCGALQGFAIDGRKFGQLEVSAWIKAKEVVPGTSSDMLPVVAVTFYDQQRRGLGNRWLGPWRGTLDWHHSSSTLRVPANAREGILRIGLFGAVGEFAVDAIRMRPIAR